MTGGNYFATGGNYSTTGGNCSVASGNCSAAGRNCPAAGGNYPAAVGNCSATCRNYSAAGRNCSAAGGNCSVEERRGAVENGGERWRTAGDGRYPPFSAKIPQSRQVPGFRVASYPVSEHSTAEVLHSGPCGPGRSHGRGPQPGPFWSTVGRGFSSGKQENMAHRRPPQTKRAPWTLRAWPVARKRTSTGAVLVDVFSKSKSCEFQFH